MNNTLPDIKDFLIGNTATEFQTKAIEIFQYQYANNDVYRGFVDALRICPDSVYNIQSIPYLPISFFKSHTVLSAPYSDNMLRFESSKTTGDTPSVHYIADAILYRDSLLAGFNKFYGNPADYAILALLPSYLERKNASLVHMVNALMAESRHPDCGFYLDEWDKLSTTLAKLEMLGQKTILVGVTFALLDFAAAYPMQLANTIVMETGGMKGRREEWTREQVHSFLRKQWQLSEVHSEYGMTELLSQAYSKHEGIFWPSPTMKILVRDINDPLDIMTEGVGCINVIDLANIHSCSFIATEDVGRLNADGSLEVLGRMDHAALRGCNLMVV